MSISRRRRLFLLTTQSALAAFPFLLWPDLASAQLLTGFDETPPAAENGAQAAPLTQPDAASPIIATAPANSAPVSPPGGAVLPEPLSAIPTPNAEPVRLDADKMEHDERTGIITASGNVFLVQEGRILRADEMTYNLKTDIAEAHGHVVLNEENGTIHYADNVKFNDKLKNGFVDQLKVYLADGGRFTAKDGKREDARYTVMNDASYTPCELCKSDPSRPPLWDLRASKVTHDDQERRITYDNARFEVKGVPIAYAPYFSHPDGSIKRKSGFLAPAARYRSDNGAMLTNRYYWDIAPEQDATVGLAVMTRDNPLLTAEYRRRWAQAQLTAFGGVTNSRRVDEVGGQQVDQKSEWRGHILADALWDINDLWRAGSRVQWTSDNQYMRQYGFGDQNVLQNELYAERFSDRDYFVARALKFQDIRAREFQIDQPEVLPQMNAEFIGDPDSVPLIQGRWRADASFLGLQREGSGQDMNRLSLKGEWERRLISDYGLVADVKGSARQDFYSARDHKVTNPQDERSQTATRFFPQANAEISYPMAKPMDAMQATIEPVVGFTLAPNIDVTDDIPNEDSQDAQVDVANLFDENRFPGYDRIEDQSRMTYGLRTGLYGYNGGQGEFFIGQSRRFKKDDNPFPAGSGLNRQSSDVVGQATAMVGDRYDFTYKFQLASDTLASERHEAGASGNWGRLRLGARYIFASPLADTDITEDREQAQASAGYYFTRRWRGRASATEDLGANPGLRRATLGLDYFGQCLSWSLQARRNLTDEASGDSHTEISFNLGLKNLGGFSEPDWKGGK